MKPKICPLLSVAAAIRFSSQDEKACIQEKCAWFNRAKDQCIILSLLDLLKELKK